MKIIVVAMLAAAVVPGQPTGSFVDTVGLTDSASASVATPPVAASRVAPGNGMTAGEVRRILGSPDIMHADAGGRTAWVYRVNDGRSAARDCRVWFRDGAVVGWPEPARGVPDRRCWRH